MFLAHFYGLSTVLTDRYQVLYTPVTSDTRAPGAIPVPVQRTELTRVSSGLSFIEGVLIGARALHVLNLIYTVVWLYRTPIPVRRMG